MMKNFMLIIAFLAGMSAAATADPGPSPLTPYPVPYTPTIDFATHGDLSVSYSLQSGLAVQTLGQVCYTFNVTATPTYTTSAGDLRISLPAVVGNTVTAVNAWRVAGSITWPVGVTQAFSLPIQGAQYIVIRGTGTATSAQSFGVTQFPSGVAYALSGSGCYFTN